MPAYKEPLLHAGGEILGMDIGQNVVRIPDITPTNTHTCND
jgi:hypothetical protein